MKRLLKPRHAVVSGLEAKPQAVALGHEGRKLDTALLEGGSRGAMGSLLRSQRRRGFGHPVLEIGDMRRAGLAHGLAPGQCQPQPVMLSFECLMDHF